MIRFKYQKEKSDLGIVYRPIAHTILKVKDFKVEIPLYIDSGADITLIPLGLGQALGFKQNSIQIREIKGVSGGRVPYIIKTAKIYLGDAGIEARIAWALTEEAPPLLGRLDVFDKFRIVFDEKRKVVEFYPNK
ncbi:hypothetical protein MYX06_04790 [Patescibacteria group bacterium AH-259-L05]|nr:hypothetical protein [Patescibacteria group bacterium AH-259-L05]